MEMCAGWDGVAWTAPHRPESSVAVVRSVESTREMGHAARGRLGGEACKTLYRTLLVRRTTLYTIPYIDTVAHTLSRRIHTVLDTAHRGAAAGRR